MVEISITNEQQVRAALAPATAGGKPAKLDPNKTPTWEVVSGESTIIPSADGLSCDMVSSDNPGDTQILVKADADVGDGVEEISDIIKLTVLGARAANLGLMLGPPSNKF